MPIALKIQFNLVQQTFLEFIQGTALDAAVLDAAILRSLDNDKK